MTKNYQKMSKHDYWVINKNLNNDHFDYHPEKYLMKRNLYLPNWRKKLYCSFNKRDTNRLARALSRISSLTLPQAKYVICASKWWEHTYFVTNIINLFDPGLAKKIVKDLDILDDGGPTNAARVNSPEYRKALSLKFSSAMRKKIVHPNGSITIELDTENEPDILKSTPEEKEVFDKEVREYKALIGQELADFCRKHKECQSFLILYLRIWSHNYIHYSYHADYRVVSREIMKAADDLKAKDFQALAKDFEKFYGWWD